MKIKRIKRDPYVMGLDESDIHWTLVGQLQHSWPEGLMYYVVNSHWLGNKSWEVASKKTDKKGQPVAHYEVDLSKHWCSCPANTYHNACDHVTAMRIRSRLQFEPRKEKTR